jgi:hypothetical protein
MFIPNHKLPARYGVSDRTIDRWKNDPEMAFPDGVEINGRWYYPEEKLIEWERSRVGKRKSA